MKLGTIVTHAGELFGEQAEEQRPVGGVDTVRAGVGQELAVSVTLGLRDTE